MERLVAAIKRQSTLLDSRIGQARFATVSSVDADTGLVRVVLRPEGTLTGWLPVLTNWCGAGWGLICLPSPGDQVLVLPQEGNTEHNVVLGRIFSDLQKPPKAPVGELWMVHPQGQALKLKNDGTVTIEGDLVVNGDIKDRRGTLGRLRATFNAHRHLDSMGRLTSPPLAED